jgi:hypothetical protein
LFFIVFVSSFNPFVDSFQVLEICFERCKTMSVEVDNISVFLVTWPKNMKSSLSSTSYAHAYAIPVEENQAFLAASDNPVYTPFSSSVTAQASAPSSTFLNNGNSTLYDEGRIREFLISQKWPSGLQDTFIANLQKIPIRFFICDNSGSMNTTDGHDIYEYDGQTKVRTCSRWKELSSSLQFHARVSHAGHIPSQFRLLNDYSAPFLIGNPDIFGSKEEETENVSDFLRLLTSHTPSGGTPLCYQINQVVRQITEIAPDLRANNQKACVIIATDGESTDGNIAQALKPLERLPAWVVIRLCTDEERIVNYWNNIDNDLELEIDVLDDLGGEAEEIAENNPWLTYGQPLHRIREFGIPVKELDLLDEKSLTLDQIRVFAALL